MYMYKYVVTNIYTWIYTYSQIYYHIHTQTHIHIHVYLCIYICIWKPAIFNPSRGAAPVCVCLWMCVANMGVAFLNVYIIHLCEMTHLQVWHDSFKCVPWFIHTRDTTHSCLWHTSFICMSITWPNRMYVWHKSSISIRSLINWQRFVTLDFFTTPPFHCNLFLFFLTIFHWPMTRQ